MASIARPLRRIWVEVDLKKFLINFNLEKLLSPLATLIGIVNNMRKATLRFGAKFNFVTNCSTSRGLSFFDKSVETTYISSANSTPLKSDESPSVKIISKSLQCDIKLSLGIFFKKYISYRNWKYLLWSLSSLKRVSKAFIA